MNIDTPSYPIKPISHYPTYVPNVWYYPAPAPLPPLKGVWVVSTFDSLYGIYATAEDAVKAHGDCTYKMIKFVEFGEVSP